MYREVSKIESQTVVDSNTGEVLDTTTKSTHKIEEYKKCKPDEFVMVYLQDLSGFLKLENATQIKLLSFIWKEVGYNNPETNEGNVIAILKDDKERWANILDVSVRTIDNALAALTKKKLLLSEARGKYSLNPKYYFKGSTKDRAKVLEMKITYQIEDE